jgi:hypothetical protein
MAIDPIADTNVVSGAFKHLKGIGSGAAQEAQAYALLSNSSYKWVVPREVFTELAKRFNKTQLGDIGFMLRHLNITVMRSKVAAAIRKHPKFKQILDAICKAHGNPKSGSPGYFDALYAAYAQHLKLPYVGSKDTANVVNLLYNQGKLSIRGYTIKGAATSGIS